MVNTLRQSASGMGLPSRMDRKAPSPEANAPVQCSMFMVSCIVLGEGCHGKDLVKGR